MLYEKDNPFTCYGGEENGTLIDRNYSGTVGASYVADNAAVITARATRGILYRDGSPLVTNYRRDFVVLGESSPLLIIISRGEIKSGAPYLNFVFPGVKCSMAIEDNSEVICNLGDNLAVMRFLKLSGQDATHHLVPIDGHNEATRLVQCFPEDGGPFVSVVVCETGEARSKVFVKETSTPELSLSVTSTAGQQFEIHMPSLDANIAVSAG